MRLFGVIRLSLLSIGIMALSPVEAFAQCQPLATASTNKALIRGLFCLPAIDQVEDPAIVSRLPTESADAVAKLIATALGTSPTASSSAGFTLGRADKATGDRPLKSDSFGPTFADRPLTNGTGVLSIGFNYQYAKTAFGAGSDVTADGRTVGLPFIDETVVYPNLTQFITRRMRMDARSQTFSVLAAYGVNDRLDLGVQVPIVSLRLAGYQDEAWNTSNTWVQGDGRPGPIGDRAISSVFEHSASGIGDVTFRLKYSVAGGVQEGAAVAVDVRLPTGSEEELLGSGEAAVKLQVLVLKSGFGRASFHANGGYTIGGLSDEINYVFGVDTPLAGNKLTASATFLGHTLRGGALPSPVRTYLGPTVSTPFGPGFTQIHRFAWEEQNLNLMQVAAGVKIRVGRRGLLTGTLLIPLNRSGLQPKISPVIGFERTWDR